MKKHFLMASAAAFAALLFLLGCNREVPVSDDVRTEKVSLWFEGTSNPDTRVSVDGTTGVGTWSVGDRIAIWVQNNDASVGMYQIKAIDDIEVGNESTGHVMISLAADQNRANYAIFPHTAAVEAHHSAGDLYITYPAEYDYSRISVADCADYSPTPMVAINNPVNHSDPSATVPPLEFYHVGGVFRVTVKNVPSAAVYLRFSFPEEMKFSGTFKVNVGTTGTDAEKMQAATLTDVSGETYGNIITIKLPVDNGGGDITLNIPLPLGAYNATDRSFKIEALTEKLAFMEITDFVNWNQIRRAEGKIAETLPLETLGTINGLYLTRGFLYRSIASSVNPSQMSITDNDQISAAFYYGKDLNTYGKRCYFYFTELGKIMTGNSSFSGASFEDAEITIDGVKYRVPSSEDWFLMTVYDRPGSTVNGVSGRKYSKVNVDLTGSDYTGISNSLHINGLLLYPDGGNFKTSVTNFNDILQPFETISFSEYRRLCDGSSRCVFLPYLGIFQSTFWVGGNEYGSYWSSNYDNVHYQGYFLHVSGNQIIPRCDNNSTRLHPVRLLRE